MVEKSVENKIEVVAKLFGIEEIKDIQLLDSSQNKVYKVFNGDKYFVIKEFSKDAIKNYYHLNKRKAQMNISYVLSKKGIETAKPLKCKDKYFKLYKGRYYVVYDYLEKKSLRAEDLTIEHIRVLAKTQSMIHKLDFDVGLSCSYSIVDIDYDKYLKKSKRIDDELYQVLLMNIDKLKEITDKCNRSIKNMKQNLCIGHNDYKLLNILWDKLELTLIDFDATGYSNPTCSLCESAFTFSRINKKINYDFYKEYIKTYLDDYGVIEEDFKEALMGSFNGKLQWLRYMMSKNHLKKDNYINGTIGMIKELVLYYDNIDTFNEIYLEVK